MKTLWIVEKATGRKLWYCVRESWGQPSYSFDLGSTWHVTRTGAYKAARDASTLIYATP